MTYVESVELMITISVPPELECTINERARQGGVTPETLILDSLREQFHYEAPEQTSVAESQEDSARSPGADFLLSMAALFESGTNDTSENHRAVVAAAIDRKHGL